MPVPQAILDALGTVQGDADSMAAATGDSDSKNQAAVEARHLADVARASVGAAVSQLTADRAALLKLIEETYKTT